MDESALNRKMLNITAYASQYCEAVENAREMEKDEFVERMTELLPQIYGEFAGLSPEDVGVLDYGYYQTYVDVFLETFEEDMKYSDTPIAASIAESLADIFQALYNFIMVVKETDGQELAGAYVECRENFASYWSQTLCNVLRALNHLRFNQ